MATLKKICPICALVSLTWVTMLALKWLGYDVNNELIAMLMGGSAVGISYVLGAQMQTLSSMASMLWKLIAIPLGFGALYALLQFSWWYAAGAVVAYVCAWILFKNISVVPKDKRGAHDISNALDACCE
ncbi:MAG: hypothetical protein AMXMBFR44_0450 [Candidatus Campbellbacteria bacterium]